MDDDRRYDRRTVLGMTATGVLGATAGCTGDGGDGNGGDGDGDDGDGDGSGGDGTTAAATSTEMDSGATSTPTGTDPGADESTPTPTETASEQLTGCQGFEAEMVQYEPPENGLVATFEYPDFPNARTEYEVGEAAGVTTVSVNIANREIAVLLNQNNSTDYLDPSGLEVLTETTFNGETVTVEGKLTEGRPTFYEWYLVVPFDGNQYSFRNENRYFDGDAGEDCKELLRSTAADIAETFSVRPNAEPPS